MNSYVALWLGLAVSLFWAVGAYNRLMRLRSQGLAAFAILDDLLVQFVTMTRQDVSDSAALVAAAEQFQASLKVSRSRPLNGPTTSALKTAYATLCSCWSRSPEMATGSTGTGMPGSLPSQREQLAVQIELARSEFNKSVTRYNAAINQFPALVLARIFGFRPAQTM